MTTIAPADYGFTGTDGSKLAGARPELLDLLAQLRQLAADQGDAFTIESGVRSSIHQAALYAAWVARGKTGLPAAKPGNSLHEYGAAADLHVTQSADGSSAAALRRLAGIWRKLGGVWGGDYHTPDVVHFALGITLAEARAAYTPELASAANAGRLVHGASAGGGSVGPVGVTR